MMMQNDPDYDEFEKLLDDFIKSEFEAHQDNSNSTDDDTPTDNTNDSPDDSDITLSEDDDSDAGSDDVACLDDTDTDDSDDTDTTDTVSGFFPSGEIEQNLNLSVKVEVLRPIARPREELEKLVGCDDIRRRMDELVALTSYNRMLQQHFPEVKRHAVSLHSVFLGRPGTGKTTVCKIFGSLLREAGALTKGHVVVCDRGTFIGTLWGDEERAMRQVLDMARGGVLMIDEAYLLNGKHENDPGRLVIQLMMNILADESQRDIAVVLCGYREPMLRLLETNPGLESRFPNRFEFADFTVAELQEITLRRIREYHYRFTHDAWEKYCAQLTQAYSGRNAETWGNARFVANQLERIYVRHASRCVSQRPADRGDLLLITPDDIAPMEAPRQRARIGF